MARPEGHKDVSYLSEVIESNKVTVIKFVPALLKAFIDYPESLNITTLKCVQCAGEALPAALAQRLCERLPHATLHNLYGPTEATVDATSWSWSWSNGDLPARIPIGRPIANTQIYILDVQGEPVPAGVTGELYIGGAGVARGI